MKNLFLLWVDEAGRGSWAGPVVAGACAMRAGTKYDFSPLLNDSKKLSPKKRREIFEMMQESISLGFCFGWVGIIGSEIIDQVGIREANRLAMQEALAQVLLQVWESFEFIKIDGRDNYRFDAIEQEKVKYIVRGDTFIPEIQAASILAKVSRDTLMERLAITYPNYGFEKHKGYGTRLHEELLNIHNPSDIHRKSYAPIKKLILREESV
ncbi:MAG: ribonuclease HII [uncultured bacterium (gcode 4)]|uniref:Ribonuclease n=1 Tax=uncultured bacterium (gcode 4) TaxID=1234023 RepID=K1YYC5_9BACT|nr:MAG: ribonuclease HII [uncultured bacterium (gcode 4)]